jgi:acyl-homoserine-lactone acylase
VRGWGALIAAVIALVVPATAGATSAVVRRTAHGIPHIQASNYRGIGFGYGYAFAQDNICPIAEAYVTVRGERSRFFGPTGSYEMRGNGFEANNLNSDFFWKQVQDSKVIERLRAQKPPKGPRPALKQGVRGYVAGYNRYLREVGGSKGVRDPVCKGKPWVRPITVKDAYLRFYQLVLLASQDVAIDGIASAQPPTPPVPLPAPVISPSSIARGLEERFPLDGPGSNAVAVGRKGTRDRKHGLLLGNPHFPWQGTERFYQAHLTIPGKLNVQGASLFGVPLVLIGHTRTMAWSHTVSTAYRFTPYQLTLVPGSPTTYLYDGKPEKMSSRKVTVRVRQSNGTLKPQSRTLYSTRFGPMFNELAGVPLPWTPTTAFAMRDANADNFRIFNHFFDVDRARSAPAVLRILRKYEGIPWVNTIAADRAGRALYADIGSIPNVTDQKASDCNTAVGNATFTLLGLPVLDGSRSACEWGSDPDAVQPGLFGPSHLPHLFRGDYVTNSNDSYWLSNPHHPLTGFARIIGDERTERSLRTRIGLIMTQANVNHRGFSRKRMQKMVFKDRQYAGELTRGALVGMCRQMGLGAPCDALAKWDLRENTGSRGALLFRRFWERAKGATPSPWKVPFDPAHPVRTPNTLDTSNPQVRQALTDAIADLNAASIPFNAPLGQFQFVLRNGVKIPIHGGPGTDGDFNAINVTWKSGKGPSDIEHGSSYVQVVTWGRGRCPNARTILTYSQSVNRRSRFYADQTRMFSRKRWVSDRFCAGAVRKHSVSKTLLRGGKKTRVLRGRRARR